MAAGGALFVGGLVLLGALLLATVRRRVERRFDVAVAAYVTALAAGVAAAGLGVTMAVGTPSPELRAAHVTLNLLGLVGLVIGGTLPFFAATVGRTRMAPCARRLGLALVLCWQAGAVGVAAAGLASGAGPVAGTGLGCYAAGVAAVVAMLPRPTRRQLRWAGPRLLALWAGAGWWAAAVSVSAAEAWSGDGAALAGRWLLVLVVAGYLQVMWGSLAYLLPMLRGGGHERLGQGFATTRSWVGLGAANVAGLALAVAAPRVAAAAMAVWFVDAAGRAAAIWWTGRGPNPLRG